MPWHIEKKVAPFTGAWIEILSSGWRRPGLDVAPFTGAWIEIPTGRYHQLPTLVAPFTGAWIEIADTESHRSAYEGRSLHGSVD